MLCHVCVAQENADGLRAQLDQQQRAVDQLLGNTRVLEGKLAEAKSKKETLKARAASAKTSKQIQEMIGSLNTSNAVVAFEKMEEKVRARAGGRAATGGGQEPRPHGGSLRVRQAPTTGAHGGWQW